MLKYLSIIGLALLFILPVSNVGSREAALEVHTAVSCATTTTEALAANTSRISALLINDGATVIYMKIGEAAVLNQGIRLNASGGSYYMTAGDGNLDTEAVNCIVASGTETIMVTEWSTQ